MSWQDERKYIWRFNEISGTIAYSDSGAFPLTGTNASFISGHLNNSANLVNGYFTGADDPLLEPGTGNFTVCGWAYTKSQNHTVLVSKNSSGDSTNNMQAWISGAAASLGKIAIRVGALADEANSTEIFPLNEWVFFWFRRTGTLVEFGWTKASTKVREQSNKVQLTTSNSVGVNAQPFRIGFCTGGTAWNGFVDQIEFYPTYSLSNAELDEKYNGGIGTENYMPDNTLKVQHIGNHKFAATRSGNTEELFNGWKIGEIFGNDTTTTLTANTRLYISRYTAFQSAILTKIAFRIYIPVAGGKIKFAIYKAQGSGPYGGGGGLLGYTGDYVMKANTVGGDHDFIPIVNLVSPVQIYAGETYWMAMISDSAPQIFSLCASARTTNGVYYDGQTYAGCFTDALPAATAAGPMFAIAAF